MTEYIGELNRPMTEILCSIMSRGLLRLEGFAMRLHPEAVSYYCSIRSCHGDPKLTWSQHKYQIRVNCMLFTLPANVRYISDTLQANNLYLLDPVPPYDPSRHVDTPVYENPHGGGAISYHAAQRAQAHLYNNGSWGAPNLGSGLGQERINQVDVQRQQVDEVFTSLEAAGELDQSDPGPYIKTQLFPHQRKALTFLLQREQDSSALKRGKKYAERATKKKDRSKEKNGTSSTKDGKAENEKVNADTNGDGGGNKSDAEKGDEHDGEKTAATTVDGSAEATPVPEEVSNKARDNRTLWEGVKDEKGKVKKWKNRVTGEIMKTKKGDKPPDCKGAILADDVSHICLHRTEDSC